MQMSPREARSPREILDFHTLCTHLAEAPPNQEGQSTNGEPRSGCPMAPARPWCSTYIGMRVQGQELFPPCEQGGTQKAGEVQDRPSEPGKDTCFQLPVPKEANEKVTKHSWRIFVSPEHNPLNLR
jgi:hypothetical protein